MTGSGLASGCHAMPPHAGLGLASEVSPLRNYAVFARQNSSPEWKQMEPVSTSPACTWDDGQWWCSWVTSRETLTEFSWLRTTENAGDAGPRHDHTVWNTHTQRGYYMLARSKANGGKSGWLTSPWLHRTAMPCTVQFWYYMHGSAVSTLSLQVRNSSSVWQIIWDKSWNQGNSWKQATVQVAHPGTVWPA